MLINESNSYSFIQIGNSLRASLEQLMVEIGLHSGQVLVLERLWENDCQSQAELVRALSVTPPTVYNLVVKLEKSGFVEMTKRPGNSRNVCVSLTQKGIDIRSLVEEQWKKLEDSIFQELSEPEKMMLSLLLKKINSRQ